MVMIKDTWKPAPQSRRLGVAEAKSKLSEILRDAAAGPTIIHNRGKDLAVVLAIEEYERLTAGKKAERSGGAAFLERVEALKQRLGGGVDDFEPARFAFEPVQPFGRKKAGRG
jgi:prevent-host-death family protein